MMLISSFGSKQKMFQWKASLAFVMTLATLVYMTGCAGAKKKAEDEADGGGIPTAASADDNAQTGDSDSNRAMGLQTVHFPFDSSVLDKEAKEVLHANAEILKANPSLKVQVEGHCDERGGIQYNIALGERRAKVARSFLQDLGIADDRITVISFGKEKPIDPGNSEEAYAKNRRDNFAITSR